MRRPVPRLPTNLARHLAMGCATIATAVAVVMASPQAPFSSVKSTLFDAPQLLRDLQILSSDDMEGRQIGTRGGERARVYLAKRFKAVGIMPAGSRYESTFTAPAQGWSRPARTGVNLVGRLDGRRTPARYIVVSAHYDHVGVRNGRVFNGAGDNASGAAALLAVASYFRAHPPANPLLIVAFDGEEQGLLGSRAFVKAPPVDPLTLALNINADMLGRDPKDELYVVGAARQPFLRPHIERVAARAPVHLLMGHEDPTGRSDDWTEDSDQYAFIEAGIPAFYVGVEDKPYHHQPTDDFETIAHDFYVRAVETLIALIREFDAHLDSVPRKPGLIGAHPVP